jgi:hypothetical protein
MLRHRVSKHCTYWSLIISRTVQRAVHLKTSTVIMQVTFKIQRNICHGPCSHPLLRHKYIGYEKGDRPVSTTINLNYLRNLTNKVLRRIYFPNADVYDMFELVVRFFTQSTRVVFTTFRHYITDTKTLSPKKNNL